MVDEYKKLTIRQVKYIIKIMSDIEGEPSRPPWEMAPAEREAHVIKTLLSDYEAGIEQRLTTSDFNAADMEEKVAQARKNNTDLSNIPDLDARLERLQREGPRVAVERTVEESQKLVAGDDREKVGAGSWYWSGRKKLEVYGNKLSEPQRQNLRQQLSDVAHTLGLDDALPVVMDAKNEPYPAMGNYEWESEEPEDETFISKARALENIKTNTINHLNEARDRREQYQRWHDITWANAREQLATRVPQNSVSQRILRKLSDYDRNLAANQSTFDQLINRQQQELEDIFATAQPEYVTLADIRSLEDKAREFIQHCKDQELQLREKQEEFGRLTQEALGMFGYTFSQEPPKET